MATRLSEGTIQASTPARPPVGFLEDHPAAAEWVIVALAAALFLVGLGSDALRDWDEATYACVAREMAGGGDWLSPTMEGSYYPVKPPLLVWLIAAGFSTFGESEVAVRLPAALFGVLGVWAVARIGRRLYGPFAGPLAAVILATAPQWLRFSRQGMIDVPLATAAALAVLGLLARSPWLLGGALGVAFMLKGPAALPMLLAASLWVVVAGRDHWRTFSRGVLLAMAIALPWHLHQLVVHGTDFTSYYIGVNLVQRTTSAVEGHQGPWWHYLERVFFHWVNPWHYLGAAAVVVLTFRTWKRRISGDEVLLASWFWVPLLLLSVARTKLHWYAMPLYPPLAVITAGWVATELPARRWLRCATVTLAIATVATSAAEVATRSLANRASEATRTVLRSLPPARMAPVLWVSNTLPRETARFYARRQVRAWDPAAPAQGAPWVLAHQEAAELPPGYRPVAVDGDRLLLAADESGP